MLCKSYLILVTWITLINLRLGTNVALSLAHLQLNRKLARLIKRI